jgi:cytochrome c-type biogenesis protein CcmH/NrfG
MLLPAAAQTSSSESLINQGMRATQSGDEVAAASFFTQAVVADPGNMKARRLLALAELHEGRAASAFSIMQTVMKYERSVDDLACLGDIYFALGRQDFARWAYEEVLQSAPMNGQSIAGLVNVYIATQQYDKAKQLCQGVLSKSTDRNLNTVLTGKLSQIESAEKVVAAGKLGA